MFKRGDFVRRLFGNGPHDEVILGHCYYVERQDSSYALYLQGLPHSFDPSYFELVTAATGAQGLPRKHCETIKAWADGAPIEMRIPGLTDEGWSETPTPKWSDSMEYRVKPTPRPDVVQYFRALQAPCRMNMDMAIADGLVSWCSVSRSGTDNVQVTFDGETGKLKSVEIVQSVV